MKISIFGLGYVGCISLGCLAQNGHDVIGVDLNHTKVEFINNGKSTVVEEEIDEIISEQRKLNRISATDKGCQAVINTEVSFICVGTPSTSNGHLNLDAIFKVAKEIGKGLREKNEFHIIIIRSTVIPGTNDKVSRIIEDISGKKCEKDFVVVSNPEFLREGSSVKDYYSPPYTIIGTKNKRAIEKMKMLYEGFDAPFIVTDIKIAELIKYVNNAFHALKVTFANEIGNICKMLKIDSHKLMEIFCLDKKLNISPYYLRPGFAYGGSCLPKDLKALKTIAHDFYLNCTVLEDIEKSNENQKEIVFNQILQLNKKRIGFLGLSFKAGTDDVRNSPILDIIERLLGKGFEIKIYDRNVRLSQLTGANRKYILKKIPYVSRFIFDDPIEIIENSDILVVVNNEDEFRSLLETVPENKIIYDLINIGYQKREKNHNYIGLNW